MPSTSGATGMPCSSITQPSTPNTSITQMPYGLLVMANDPTMQNSRITGSSMGLGARRMRPALLMAAQPSGSISRLARMKMMNTA